MPFLRKYNTLLVTGTTSIRIPIIKRGVVDFAIGADWTPVAGDVKVFVDGAAVANITNLPAAVASGNGAFWEFILTAAELSCKQLLVVVSDAATKTVEDQSFIVETYGHASAMYVTDFSAQLATPTNITAATGVVLSGVTHAGAVIPTVSAVTGLTASNLDTTVSSRMATYAQPTGFLAATFPAGTVANTTNITAGTITTATNLTTNNDKTGYGLSAAAVQAIWDALTSALTVAGSIGKKLADWVIGTTQTGDSFARLGAPAGASVSADIAAVKAETASIQTDTNDIQTRLPAALVGGRIAANAEVVGDKTGYALSAAGVQAVWDYAVEGSMTAVQAVRGMFAALCNKLSGSGTTTVVIRDAADTKARITATCDGDGNRTAVTTDLT